MSAGLRSQQAALHEIRLPVFGLPFLKNHQTAQATRGVQLGPAIRFPAPHRQPVDFAY
jgi:hypothetical protein